MKARAFNITAKERVQRLSSLQDFSLEDAGEFDASQFLSNPTLSLYCLDEATRVAVFVETSEPIDFARVPFMYQAQFEAAERVISLPYKGFLQLSKELKPPEQFICLHNIGRCGSTLLNQVFNELPDVQSFSEPDVLSQFIHLRKADGSNQKVLVSLIQASIRFLFKPNPFKLTSIHCIKLRNQCIEVADLYHEAFPEVVNLFLYRNAIDWARSLYRIIRANRSADNIELDDVIARSTEYNNRDVSHFRNYFEPGTKNIEMEEMFCLWWLILMERYLYHQEKGIPFTAFRYEDLVEKKEKTLLAIFEACRITPGHLEAALKGFKQDSQRGTRLARAASDKGNSLSFTNSQTARITNLLKKHAIIKHSDFLAPSTSIS